ncbi:OsmC family protein [Nitrososphaera sp.]|uniref:OsmC family protein n=1 Tax=Nitrososphaera sp. TaxID=1971748 RepID=UPI00307FB9C1
MANMLNNVDLDKLSQTVETGRKDKSTLKKPVKLQGEWNLDPSRGYQFRTEMAFEKGKQVIEIDAPSFLGGSGNRLGPMGYCVAGMTSCFMGIFVNVASSQGIRLKKLSVSAECNVNFAKTFDVADEPIMEGIDFQVDVESDNADKSRLQQVLKMAEERCPAMYSMSHIIGVKAQLK